MSANVDLRVEATLERVQAIFIISKYAQKYSQERELCGAVLQG